jgi:Peptidase family M1 domain
MPRAILFAAVVCLVAYLPVATQTPPNAAAPNAVWNALLSGALDASKHARAENVVITRDRARITLVDGTIQFTQPANEVVFGAVFHGTGRLEIVPPNAAEAHQLQLFTKQSKVDMAFTEATFSFTDSLLDDVARQVKWQTNASSTDDLYAKRQHDREDLGESALPRLFQGVLSEDRARTAFFLADLKTKDKNWVEVRQDALQAEDLVVGRWADVVAVRHFDVWMSFPVGNKISAEVWKDPHAKEDFVIRSNKIDASVTSGAELRATDTLTIEPRFAGQRALVFALDSNLRVESIKDSSGAALPFFQSREGKDRYQSYGDYVAIVLPTALKPSTPVSLTFVYGGKRAIRQAGHGNYFCESSGWYPDRPNSFSARSDFDLTFRSPKNMVLVATGRKTSETVDGNLRISTWKSDIPLAVAGFAYGDYKVSTDKADDVGVEIYANREPDDVMMTIQRVVESRGGAATGILTPAAMTKSMGAEMANMIRVFDSFYGPYPYKQLAVTSMPISYSYGQGWPGLIYLWSASFLDPTQRHVLGVRDETAVTDFFRAHEASHQWWGHRVGWKSYHDQWLSEGFAEFSGNLYVEYRQNHKEYLNRWKKEKELLKMRDTHGHPIDFLGPIWMGQRIASSETDDSSYQNLIYSKGGFVLQMLRSQMSDPHNPDLDHLFKDTMRDYCKTFDNQPASTEDFKNIVERHMTRGMDLDGTRKMDWFFNQYVYGIGFPEYTFHATVESTPDGKSRIKGQFTRKGVPDDWKDVVPIYAHLGNKVARLGTIAVHKNDQQLDAVVPMKVDRITINDEEDLLADVHQ